VLTIGGESEEGYDPTLGWGRYGSPLFQSTLLRRDEDLNIVNDLATDYTVSDDGLTWTVTIRDDAVFSDGEPLTAADVAYTFNKAAESGGLTDVTMLEEAVATDDTTVAAAAQAAPEHLCEPLNYPGHCAQARPWPRLCPQPDWVWPLPTGAVG